jgi:hypothetical protein
MRPGKPMEHCVRGRSLDGAASRTCEIPKGVFCVEKEN